MGMPSSLVDSRSPLSWSSLLEMSFFPIGGIQISFILIIRQQTAKPVLLNILEGMQYVPHSHHVDIAEKSEVPGP
jgi:hypothetical protein